MRLFSCIVVLLAAMVGCSDIDNALTGKLELTITGLPSGTLAGVAVAGTGFNQVVNSDQTLSGLQPGVYNVTTGIVTAGGSDYTATPSASTVTVAAGSSVSKTVTFARVLKGNLSITVTGLPTSALANVSVTGANGFSTVVNGDQTLSGLQPGVYTLTTGVVTSGGSDYAATPNSSTVTVVADSSVSKTIAFAKVLKGNLSITVTGLPSGVNASVSVTGANGFAQNLTGNATLSNIAVGSYTVAASAVLSGADSYVPTVAPASITVTDGTTVSSTVTYTLNQSAVPGALAITVTGLPAATPANVLVTGPNGFSQVVTTSQTLSNLVQGTYQVTASAFEANFIGYTSSLNQSVVITDGNTSASTVAYAVVYTNFANFTGLAATATRTLQEGDFGRYSYGDPTGTASAAAIAVGNDAVSTSYTLNPGNFGGVAIFVNGKSDASLTDFTGYTTLRIALSSSTRTQLQVKIGGNEPNVRDAGCYPVLLVNVTPTLTNYELRIADFAPRGFCGANGRTIVQTISNVVAVEVEDNNLPATGAISSTTTLGNVRFVK